ncbi:hypothetical protein SAMN02746089_02514 [Caldanaerobius fijiensis DSM 17918]|uniref:Uncharacterized protein n=1 Tax=Caldanaerobius fijiensis DSM 17918 TaxID=1121256 RepID=A0A1M5EB74_9THEO|nr:hypothetical protein [Caldanaerobius fijiensis]SHF76447.1 hypothetical protein SAMN02746089_02514 [Caldanaerobius fijiensis DSM 17918]
MIFKVPITFISSGYIYVEANDIDEAIQKVHQGEGEIDFWETEFVENSVQIIDKNEIETI